MSDEHVKFVANCPICGRFCKSTETTGYDGTWNQIYVHTYCSQCGEKEETVV